jgi:hypothetical protein
MWHNRCLNKYVLVATAAVLGAVVLLRPSLAGPVLLLALVATCPVIMLCMMRMNNEQTAGAADTAL